MIFSRATCFFFAWLAWRGGPNWKSYPDFFFSFLKNLFFYNITVINRKKFCLVKMYYCEGGPGEGKGGGVDQWEAPNWSCDHRANERPQTDHVTTGPQKKLHGKRTSRNTQTDFLTTRPTRPRGPSWWKLSLLLSCFVWLKYVTHQLYFVPWSKEMKKSKPAVFFCHLCHN